ncbi:MFS transporter [Parafrankia sp. BMG5.11]|uniref:MFS transporter n=1 Tax=Parafrankia sp. BMG5.11 TaxID=222540 RepID=UPI00103AE536|nr:MFS transporter [Parafrankia sp. BMG5.11]TCJ39894.1 MFS transporter [Parafrankia sp. BMG5.11]
MSEPNATAAVEADDSTVPAYSWYALGVLVLIYVLNFVDRQILSILANDIKADLEVDDAFLGFLYGTAFAIFYALFGIPLGKLADSWHRVRLMSIGLALWSLMTAVSGFAKNAGVLTGARIGVGIGEATAGPSAYSLISDWFPARLRATALAIYSSGLYIGGGVSLLIGGLIVEGWNDAFPVGSRPFGLAGWQAAFIAVGLPGLLLAAWVLTLREPARGAIDGIPTPPHPAPFREFFDELVQIIPPFTLVGALRRGPAALALNLLAAAGFAVAAVLLTRWVYAGPGKIIPAVSDQWLFLGVGYYAVFSWASGQRARDLPTYRLTWGSPAFLATILGYGTVSFVSYAASFFAAPYGEVAFAIPKTQLGWLVGAPAAVAGLLGVILGGRIADWLFVRNPAGRLYVVVFGLLSPVPAIWITFTTTSETVFYVTAALSQFFAASALGAAAATSQSLVLPRMRGVATATFFLATTLVGLALGPFLAGWVSASNGGNISLGVRSTLWAVPVGLACLIVAIRLVPAAATGMLARAGAAGESTISPA